MLKIVDFCHLIIEKYYHDSSLPFINCLDATCGKGNDTLFIAELLKERGHVDAYDIQEIAIEMTKDLINKHQLTNVSFYHDSFVNIDISKYDLAVFNLGYLPCFNKSITTTADITLQTITKLTKQILINPNLTIIICVYPGHEEGKKESDYLDQFSLNLNPSLYLVSKYLNYNRPNAPYVLTISHNKIKSAK